VLERGQIGEIGAHGELLARGGVYARLHRVQVEEAPALPRCGHGLGA
jgi:subfamily B ATP-binding cassette protein MsbA